MTSRKKLIVYNWISSLLPDFGVFNRLRKKLLSWCGVKIHPTVVCGGTVRFTGEGFISIGANSIVRDGSKFCVSNGGRITLGRNVLVGENVLLESHAFSRDSASLTIADNVDLMMSGVVSANGSASIHIGSNCKIAHNVSIKATEHEIVNEGKCIAGDCKFRDITILSGCWICAGAIITPGVTIGRHNIVGAGAVVINDSPDNVLIAGVPAIVKKHYVFKDC